MTQKTLRTLQNKEFFFCDSKFEEHLFGKPIYIQINALVLFDMWKMLYYAILLCEMILP